MPQPKDTKRAVHEDEPEGRPDQRHAKPLAVKKAEEPKQMPVPDDKTLERVNQANAVIAKENTTTERIGVVMKDKNTPQFWWVNPVKLRLLTQEEGERWLEEKRNARSQSDQGTDRVSR